MRAQPSAELPQHAQRDGLARGRVDPCFQEQEAPIDDSGMGGDDLIDPESARLNRSLVPKRWCYGLDRMTIVCELQGDLDMATLETVGSHDARSVLLCIASEPLPYWSVFIANVVKSATLCTCPMLGQSEGETSPELVFLSDVQCRDHTSPVGR